MQLLARLPLVRAGTQWVEDGNVDRARLARLPLYDEVGLSALRDPSAIHQAQAGEVLYLKGTTFPGLDGRGVVHRSPDAVDGSRPRLLLRLDPPAPRGCTDPACCGPAAAKEEATSPWSTAACCSTDKQVIFHA